MTRAVGVTHPLAADLNAVPMAYRLLVKERP